MPDQTPLTEEQLAMFDPADHKAIKRSARKALARSARRANKPAGGGFQPVPLVARNENQQDYIEALREEQQVFAIGPAGTGKTYVAARIAMQMLLAKKFDRIMLARPAVAKPKHRLGYRPGDQDGKIEDWMVPIMQGFRAEVSLHTLAGLRQQGRIEFLAFETLRGRSLEQAFIILDEAQNCDLTDLKLFLTRQGDDSMIVVCGDIDQTDIEDSGLETVVNMMDTYDIDGEIIEFTEDDVVRSPRVKEWVKAFRDYEGKSKVGSD